MTIADARTWVRQFARNAGESTMYSDADIDRAIQFVGSRFVDRTHCTRTTSPVVLTASTSTFTATVSGFRPEWVLRAWIAATAEFSIVDHTTLLQQQIDNPATAAPTTDTALLAFTGSTTGTAAGEVYPTPPSTSAYSLSVMWYEPFVDWTVGSGTPTFNIPDPYLKQILTYGVPAALQMDEEEKGYATEAWKKYLEFEERCVGKGGRGANIVIRQRGA